MSPSRRSPATRRRGRGRRGKRAFQPPHCPNPRCRFHLPHPDWHYVCDGSFRRPSDQRRIQAFECRHCGRNFSTQTFSPTYWLRRRDLLPAVAAWIAEGPALRQIARVCGASHSAVARHVARLGRHCLLFHLDLLRSADPNPLREPLVIDGFESFELSQYFPFHANLAAGRSSQFLFHFNDAPLRRKGRMTPHQKRRRAELEDQFGRPDPKAIERSIARLLRLCLQLHPSGETLTLHSDDHPAYLRALRTIRRQTPQEIIRHLITPSTARRTPANPLFAVNLADLRLRHGSANHRRETIAFSKRRQAALERLAIFTVWANCVKHCSEKGPAQTAAMRLGLLRRPLRWSRILRRRLFPGHARLPAEWRDYYERRIQTLALGARQSTHACRLAF